MKAAIIIILSFLLSFACYSFFNVHEVKRKEKEKASLADRQLRAEIIKLEEELLNDKNMETFMEKAEKLDELTAKIEK